MSRGFPAGVATTLQAQDVTMLLFAELGFSSGTLRLHTGLGSYTWGSQTWLGVGDLGAISEVQEGIDVSPYALTLSLSGVDSTITNAALTEDYFQRPVTVWLGVLDATDALIADPTQIWSGEMDQMTMSVGADGGDVVQLVCESNLARFDKSRNAMYTNVHQQARFSGDLFFSHIQNVAGVKLGWGSARGGNGPASNSSFSPDYEYNPSGRS